MPGTIKFIIPLFAAVISACTAQPGKTLPDTELGSRQLPLLDQGIPQELTAATFALG